MPQPDLLGAESGLLLDDATGRIRYLRDAVPAARAQAWFTELHEGVEWHSQRREMYGREVDVPRLTASFRLDDPALPPALREASDAVFGLTRIAFDSAGSTSIATATTAWRRTTTIWTNCSAAIRSRCCHWAPRGA